MECKRFLKGLGTITFLLAFFCISPHVNASGFAVFTQGASALGQGDASIADTDGPSDIFFNPALINSLDGTQVEGGTTLIILSREFTSDLTGNTFATERAVFFPSTLFVTHKYNEKVSFGLGVFNPFGLGTKWDDNWEGRYIATYSEMQTFNFNPVISYQMTTAITLAVGVDLLLLDATLEKRLNLDKLSAGTADGGQKLEGDGNGLGYNLGLLVDLSEDISVGASYRNEINVDLDGDVTHTNVPAPLSTIFPNSTGARTELTLPQQAHLGISYKGIKPITLNTAVRWEGWSSYDQLVIDSDLPIAGSTTNVTTKNWNDVYTLILGARYSLNDSVTLSAGYLYGESPIPDETFEPSIPDADTHLISLGAGIKYRRYKIDLAYGYQIMKSRRKSNDVDDDPATPLDITTSANGVYDTTFHLLGFSFTHTF